jgi:isocitrate dehydrogenase
MLRHLGYMEQAAKIENALLYTLESGVHTGDFGDKSKPAVNTSEFADTIITNFGKTPSHGAKPALPNQPATPTAFRLDKNPLIMTEEIEQPGPVAEKCLKHTGDLFKLVTISNRGTQVWPKGSIFTNLVNQYRCRFESLGEEPLTQTDILLLYKGLMQEFKICSTELLNMWGDKKAYSLAQGQ